MDERTRPPDPDRKDPSEVIDPRPLTPFVIEGPPVIVCVLSPWIETVHVHVEPGGRTVGCSRGQGGACQGCLTGRPLVKQHWIMVQDEAAERWTPQLCHLTPYCVDTTPLLWQTDGRLDGRWLTLWRTPCHMQGRMCGRLLQRDPPATWPTCLNVLDRLRRMWAGRSKRLPGTPPAAAHPPDIDERSSVDRS